MDRIDKLGITGHRPGKLNGYDLNTPYYENMISRFMNFFKEHNVGSVYSGMALGTDMVAAIAVLRLKKQGYNIRLIACIPCKNHSCKWPAHTRDLYDGLLESADEVVQVSNEEYNPRLMQKRNEYIVNNVEHLLAVWNGSYSGTYNCVKYAEESCKPVTVWRPTDFI